ncbi:lanthionine synthetase LanC family protein [Streptomyces griseus]|uniref:class III lanthionine synthetase LanKC N-terminal domain-containing protein n=1 Tax=Streptomyces griseus TaxID=1911 RepID=UPI00068A1F2F|nr:lanthionine synthetase LanC family protein [Streptomyces griseus]
MAVSIAGRAGVSDDTWAYLDDPRMPAMEHGWKLHVSTRPGELDAVTRLVLPVLSRYVCHAKFARDPQTLRRLNSGAVGAAAVGKAITVYPLATDLVALARELAAVLRDREGPRIVSDRRVDPKAPVYYRYGPFTGDYRTGRTGRLESVMTGPDGRVFDGLATGRYRCPPWADDPFATGSAHPGRPAPPTLGGGRYTLTAGIARTARGNVYRASDRTLGRPVVIKQARAYVGEEESGTDARHHLRNERAVLTALDGVPGVPRALDYFAHHTDEYLVTTSCGDRDLRREVLRDGPYRDDDTRPGRSLSALATRLLSVLDAIHARDVVVRDLKPDNIVLAGPGHLDQPVRTDRPIRPGQPAHTDQPVRSGHPDGSGRLGPSGPPDGPGRLGHSVHLVDFGTSEHGGTGPGGATPGYSEPVLPPTGPAAPADDHYALGATLFFAATGLDPVIVDADRATNRDRTLACLADALPGDVHRNARTTIAGLLSLDPAVRTAAADRLRTGAPAPTPARGPAPRPALLRIDDGLLDEVVAHTVAFCTAEAEAITDPARAARLHVPTSLDIYGGSSGLGLELLHHTHHPRTRETVTALARWTAARSRNLPPGLYTGRTGVELFLAEAGEGTAPHDDESPGFLPERAPDGGPPEADLIAGAAGIGTGHLLLARHALRSGDPRAAGRHLAVAADCHRALASGTARLTASGPVTPGSAALREGLAHGEAGVVSFLLAHAAWTGDPDAAARAERAADHLATLTPDVIAASAAPAATRRYGSWCRGLAGIGAVHLQAAETLADHRHLDLARQAARACLALAPRMPLVTQCCGLAGVGDLLVDVAEASGSEEFRDGAETVARLVLNRSGGTPSRPVFPDTGLSRPSATWAGGSAGVLTFFRRLRGGGGPRPGLTSPRPRGEGPGERAAGRG